mgnify:CR=1 FL=1|tara:strand:- start:20 stop:709 length:690 start_codon:yes stop_codon:yes gene_type:complete
MLALKQALSLVSTPKLGGAWSPADETTLVAWYQHKVGVTLNGSDVSQWDDSSTNGYDLLQADATEQPAYNVITGVLTFVSANLENLQTSGTQISLADDFTLGLRINTSTINGAFLADNTTSNEYFKYGATNKIQFRIAGSATSNLLLDSGAFGDDYIVITRVSDVLTLWNNGVQQTTSSPSIAGTCLIDTIGLRKANQNAFDGTIKEIQIYDSSSSDLTTNVNDRLSTL